MITRKNQNVVVLGAGLIGCYLGGYLQSGGCNVTYIGRTKGKWTTEMRGLTLTHFKRPKVHIPREDVDFQLDNTALATADIILVCVKSQDTAGAAEIIMRNALRDALIISFQNGIGNKDLIERVTGRRTLGAVVPFNVTSISGRRYHCGTEGDLIIESDKDPRLGVITKGFRKSRMGLKLVSNIDDYQWGKLLVNLNNALSALSGDTLRAGLSQRSYREVLAAMMEEGLNICRSAGVNPQTFSKASLEKTIKILRLPNFAFGPIMNLILKIDETARSSMLDDLMAGKNSEVDYLQGEIVRLANKTGQLAPINGAILNVVHQAFSVHQSPKYSGDDLASLLEGLM